MSNDANGPRSKDNEAAPRNGHDWESPTNDHLRNPGVAALEEQRAVQ